MDHVMNTLTDTGTPPPPPTHTPGRFIAFSTKPSLAMGTTISVYEEQHLQSTGEVGKRLHGAFKGKGLL